MLFRIFKKQMRQVAPRRCHNSDRDAPIQHVDPKELLGQVIVLVLRDQLKPVGLAFYEPFAILLFPLLLQLESEGIFSHQDVIEAQV